MSKLQNVGRVPRERARPTVGDVWGFPWRIGSHNLNKPPVRTADQWDGGSGGRSGSGSPVKAGLPCGRPALCYTAKIYFTAFSAFPDALMINFLSFFKTFIQL